MELDLKKIDKFRKCLKRELSKRKWVYPKLVENYKMTQQEADKEIETVEEMLEYFNWKQIHTAPVQQKLF